MPDEVILDVTTIEENVTVETTAGDVVEIQVLAPTGTAATVAVGTTTTGNAGTNASVTNSGTTSAAVFNFTIPRGDTGATGATGAAGPNSVTSATTSDGTAILDVESITGLYIDGDVFTASSGIGTAVSGSSDSGVGAAFYSQGNYGAVIGSAGGNSLKLTSVSGDYYIECENNFTTIEAAIERVRGWFVWFYNTFTGRLKTADITADRDWILPDASGTLALTSQLPTLGTNVATFLATPTSANLAAAVTDETGSGSLVFAASPTLSNLTVSGTGIVANLGTDPAVLAVGTPATTSAFVGGYYAAGSNNSTIYFGQNSYFAGGQWTQPNTSAQSATFLIQAGTFVFYSQSSGNASNSIGSLFGRFNSTGLVVGSSVINSKAKLQVDSTTQGFLPPRMTTTQRNAITSVPAGLMIYNTSLNKLNVYNGTTWETVTSL
jgi:hypothetical protein